MSNGQLLVIAGDKGFAGEEEIVGLRDPHIAVHGSFSFMVNFHSLKSYFDDKGGFTMQSMHEDGFKVRCLQCHWGLGGAGMGWDVSVRTVAPSVVVHSPSVGRSCAPRCLQSMLFFLGGEPASFMHTRWAFKEGLQEFGAESFSTLQRCVKEECPNPSLKVRVVDVRPIRDATACTLNAPSSLR